MWDQNNQASEWSGFARFVTGLLADRRLSAKWIEAPEPLNFERCQWIWCADEPGAHKGAAAGTVTFQYQLNIGRDEVETCRLILAADDSFTCFINGAETARSAEAVDSYKTPSILDLAEQFSSASEQLITLQVTNTTQGTPAGVTGKIILRLHSGEQHVYPLDPSWLASRNSEPNPATYQSTCKKAITLATVGLTLPERTPLQPWGVPGRGDGLCLSPVPQFRREFTVEKEVSQAFLLVACCGAFDAYLNGERAGEDWFAPGWPDYNHRTFYRVYDVTSSIRAGANVLSLDLAGGWYAGYLIWGRRRNHYGGSAKFAAELHIRHSDNTEKIIASDSTWKLSLDGPMREADLLMGETYDACLQNPALRLPAFDDTSWTPALLSSNIPAVAEAHPGDPVTLQEEIRPIQIMQPRPGVYVFDLGQNMVGVARLRASGPAGTEIRLRFAEVLTESGELYVEALRGARSADTYIKATDQPEQWNPRFTFHGFRYVEVTGLTEPPTLDTFTGLVLHTHMQRTGDFSCSSELVNKLFHNIVWGQKGNYLEVPTDCPQRDERAGWTADAQCFIRTGSFNYQIGTFFTKWLRDLFDAQRPEGWVCCIAPALDVFPNPDLCYMGWADAAIICPYWLYRIYGDTSPIDNYWPQMCRYIEYLEKSSDGLLRPDVGFGDWVSLNAYTSVSLVGTAYFALDALLMIQMAEAIGRHDDARRFADLYERIRAAFQKAFLTPAGVPRQVTQTACVLSLRLGLVPPAARPAVVSALLQDLHYRGERFSTGFLGLKELLPSLSEEGRHDRAMRILLQEEFPSWGYEIRHGATTIWERWDGWSEELGLQTPEMNSFNHYTFGAVGEWLFTDLAGISEIEPGWKSFNIRPRQTRELRFVRARYDSPAGEISVHWWRQGEEFHLTCQVPPNTGAKLTLPAAFGCEITESGKSLGKTTGIEISTRDATTQECLLQSGFYQFAVLPPRA